MPAVGAPGFVVMNKAKWDGLPSDLQQIIDGMSGEYAEKLSRLWDEKDQSTIRKWKAKNHVSIFLSREEEGRWERAVVPLYEALAQEKSARGLAAGESLRFCKEWVQKNVTQQSQVGVGF